MFIIDYTGDADNYMLCGYNFLSGRDTICVCCTDEKGQIHSDVVNFILTCNCMFQVFKIDEALQADIDLIVGFFAGQFYTKCKDNQIAIISKNEWAKGKIGFSRKDGTSVIIEESIKSAILRMETDIDKQLSSQNNTISLEDARQQYYARELKKDLIKNKFIDTEYAPIINSIITYYHSTQPLSHKEKYRQALHIWGREKGVSIYQKLREMGLV